ncbi:glutathione S-transferase C-terminal domain-containing protein [Labilithrix luteola]|uniref:glutathione S-transferase C-terminal domain-containing protein n=1 Tax=Labilithrix luteola TaxID=1391654 RepID=UPI0011BA921A|nr:glutathione S-transferase C-terminal domain-containing protein [Labilithrix luteola]
MPTLYSYPDLFGVADNNPFGLKVFAFMRLCGVAFEQRHVLDTSNAPRGQLPYLVDGGRTIGDSDAIIAHLKLEYGLEIDSKLSARDVDLDCMARRTLEDLYWSMSYSRWQDDRYWSSFRGALLSTHPDISAETLEAAREYNRKRYYYQGIGRYSPDRVYERGVEDLRAIASLVGDEGFVFGPSPTTLDASIYGFVANIYYYDIDTPLRQYVMSRPNLVRHTRAIHALVQPK